MRTSSAPRPRISSSLSLPASLSGLSVPESRPPLGQPRGSYVVKSTFLVIFQTSDLGAGLTLMVRVHSHRASSSDPLALGELPCSFLLEVSELVPAQPTTRRSTAHPIRKVPTTTMRCPCRATAHPPSSTCV